MSFPDDAAELPNDAPAFPSAASEQHREQFRAYVLRQLAEGRASSDIVDALIAQGYPSDYAIDFVDWVVSPGRYRGEVSGTLIEYNDGQMVEFYEDAESKRRRRAAQRYRREVARALEGGAPPALDPALQQMETTFSQELLRQRNDHSKAVKLGLAAVVVLAVVLSVICYLAAR